MTENSFILCVQEWDKEPVHFLLMQCDHLNLVKTWILKLTSEAHIHKACSPFHTIPMCWPDPAGSSRLVASSWSDVWGLVQEGGVQLLLRSSYIANAIIQTTHCTLTMHTESSQSKLNSAHSHCTLTLHIAHFTLHTHTAHSHWTLTLNTAHSTLYTSYCRLTLHTTQCSIHTVHSHCTLTLNTHTAQSHCTLTLNACTALRIEYYTLHTTGDTESLKRCG